MQMTPFALQSFLEEVMEEEMVLDGTIAQDSAQIAGIWGIREGISVALKHAGTPHILTPQLGNISMPSHELYIIIGYTSRFR